LYELLQSYIDSTFLQTYLDNYIKDFSIKETKYFSAQKTKILEKIIKMAVYFREDQILFLYQFCKVIMGKGAFESSKPTNLNDNLTIEKNVQNTHQKAQINQDINLSLNSNSYSENLNNSEINMEEKGNHIKYYLNSFLKSYKDVYFCFVFKQILYLFFIEKIFYETIKFC